MTRFAIFHHLFVAILGPLSLVLVAIPLFSAIAERFEAWVERTDWRRVDRSMSRACAIVLFSAATVLVLGILTAATSGAFTRAVR